MALRMSAATIEIGRDLRVRLPRAGAGRATPTARCPLETKNRYDHYKDWLRTLEIRARQQKNERRAADGRTGPRDSLGAPADRARRGRAVGSSRSRRRTGRCSPQGCAASPAARTKTLRIGARASRVRHIPHRMQSTTARRRRRSRSGARPCFLCPSEPPPGAEGACAFGDEWVVLCNPFPILERHLTIVHRDHVPQRLAGASSALLALAEALPGFFVIYNGPRVRRLGAGPPALPGRPPGPVPDRERTLGRARSRDSSSDRGGPVRSCCADADAARRSRTRDRAPARGCLAERTANGGAEPLRQPGRLPGAADPWRLRLPAGASTGRRPSTRRASCS